MANTKLVPTSITSDHHYHHHQHQQKHPHHHQHLRISRFSSSTLILLTVTSLLFFTWCYLRVLEKNNSNAARNASKDDDQAVQLYNESLEYFEAVQAAVNSAGHMKNRAARLREALGTLPNSTIEEQLTQQQHQRVKRSVLDLASMIKCITGCNPWSYKDYGCCYMHDNCYSAVDCHQAMVYFKPYKWGCMSYGRAKCATVSGSLCGIQLCECDRKFAKCLSRFRCPKSKASCDITKNINFVIGK
ncbi:hypothetical protein TYRP_008875 [Tyrophagus putrescentiae]|nr:hypothetical protein TYRP_008875 [Tyrophagus putrescentiae]